jgi:hypothetical protein
VETNKIDPAAQESSNDERLGVENAQIAAESEGWTFRSGIVEYVQSLSATLLASMALSLLGLFFLFVRVTSVFSGERKISKSPTTQMT